MVSQSLQHFHTHVLSKIYVHVFLLVLPFKENDNTTPKNSESTCNDIKTSNTAVIKQELDQDENENDSEVKGAESNNEADDCQPVPKRPKIEFADAESNTLQTGIIKFFIIRIFCQSQFHISCECNWFN